MPAINVLNGESISGALAVTGLVGGAMGVALRRAEAVLLGGGQQTARRNAWDAVCENRRHALDRFDDDLAPPPVPPVLLMAHRSAPRTGR